MQEQPLLKINGLDDLCWMRENLKIIDMQGRLVPLHLNLAQLKVHNCLRMQSDADLPMRIIVLKARREGVSTYIQGRFYTEINREPNKFATVASVDIDATNKVFKMAQLFETHLPETVRHKTAYSNRKEIIYAEPHRSSLLCQTAGKGVLGRGGLTHFLHATEFAFWDNAKEQFGGAAQEVPDDPGTIIAIESTANGIGDAFYDMFQDAVDSWKRFRDLNNYLPVFLPWYIFAAYSKKARKGFSLTKEEEFIAKKYGLTKDQMAWRRWAIKNKCQGDIDLFHQEYPIDPIEAFQSSGNPVFTSKMIDDQLLKCVNDPRHAIFADGRLKDVDRTSGCFKIAVLPRRRHQYAIGIDTMEGKQSDSKDAKSKLDKHGIAVLDRNTMEIVCIYTGRCDQGFLAEQSLALAKFYNDAWVAPEVPNGMVVLNHFRTQGYDNLYNRTIHDQRLVVDESDDLGWRTTNVTRNWLVDSFKDALRKGEITVIFKDIVDEMRTFIYDKTGKRVHMPSKHDDLLFASFIALQVHLRCPLEAMPYEDDFTDSAPVRAGAFDPGVEEEYVEYDLFTS